MTLNLSALKRGSAKDLMQKLQKNIEDSSKKSYGQKDDRFWSPTIDSAGNGSAIIRFLPAKTEDDLPFVKVYRHAFQENGKWFIAECPSTKGNPCPVCEDNSTHWNNGTEAGKEVARKHKRDLKYIANVLIIKDPANPANEGQIKLYRFGKKIFEKIEEALNADEDLGETPVNAFSFFDGGNFVIRTQTVGGFLNFDKCKVVAAPDLYDGNEEKLMAVIEQMHDLNEFVADSVFKSYDELKTRFLKVVGGDVSKQTDTNDDPPFDTTPKEKFEKPEQKDDNKSETSMEDDDLAFFKNMINS